MVLVGAHTRVRPKSGQIHGSAPTDVQCHRCCMRINVSHTSLTIPQIRGPIL